MIQFSYSLNNVVSFILFLSTQFFMSNICFIGLDDQHMSGLYGHRSNSSASSSPPAHGGTIGDSGGANGGLVVPQPINAKGGHSHHGSHGNHGHHPHHHMSHSGNGSSNGSGGRKYQCKMCPQVGKVRKVVVDKQEICNSEKF